MNPFESIPQEIKQTILDAKENGLTRMQICTQYGFDWDVVIHCFGESQKKIIEKEMVHQGIGYTFKWVRHRYSALSQNTKTQVLYKYLSTIAQGHYPKEFFNDRSVQRISQFRLNRLKRGIVAEIGKSLIREGHIQETLSIHPLTKIAKHLFAEHVNQQKPKPSHNDIQTRILEKDPHAMAMEIPIWGNPPITPEVVTGHIDLLRFVDDVLFILDYKPENNFMPSVPQVAFYGYLLQKNLNLKNIRCASFSNKRIWEFNPDILNEINRILSEHNINFFAWQKYI
ncbi:MAG: hypothetical protein EU530_04320 [Promethearchaeota archaeon]|nr:MAG: hypothetical protein EU530_04320 [Candidatus Lokiarchaeota archaeon]